MPNEYSGSEDDLLDAVERVRSDADFVERLKQLLERDRDILDRLAGIEHRERIEEASDRVRAAHDEALRRLADSDEG